MSRRIRDLSRLLFFVVVFVSTQQKRALRRRRFRAGVGFASFDEILVTCEKLKWTLANGEAVLRDERRSVGTLAMTKRVRVEWRPLGVVGAIVPWNYPFHNVFNPIISALFAGNAIVIKAREVVSSRFGRRRS